MSKRGQRSPSGAASLSLREWLTPARQADGSARVLRVGACGHLLLSNHEAHRVRRQLVDEVLPALIASGAGRLSLFVGMAPGADLLFLDTAAQWLSARELPFEMTALLPVPIPHLVNDWVLRAQNERRRTTRAALTALTTEAEAMLLRCTTIVPLYPDDLDAPMLRSRTFRQQQYRRLAAVLAQHADQLIAIVHPSALLEPGGTAEIVTWRQTPSAIPAELRLSAAHCAIERRLYLIDPRRPAAHQAQPADAADDKGLEDILRRAEHARRSGNELACHDIVYRALKAGLRSRRLDYLRIQALANTGNVRAALDLYHGLDLDDHELDEDWLALRGRLEKDMALADGVCPQRCARAAEAYAEAYRRYGGSYSAINAAAMLMLAGYKAGARRMARAAVRQLQPADDEVGRFYALATESEAALLLGDPQRCHEQLAAADQLLADDITRRSRTRQQLRRLCLALQQDPALIEALHLPPLVLVQTQTAMGADGSILPPLLLLLVARRALLHLAMCSPFELRLCEQLSAQGARLYLTLPAPANELARRWRGQEPDAPNRLRRLLDTADGSATLRGFLACEGAWAASQAAVMNHGLAALSASRLGLPLQTVACGTGPARRWRRGPTPTASHSEIAAPPKRRMVGLIFADFAGFARLPDPLYPRYYRDIVEAIAGLLDRHTAKVLVRKTWGDAVHVVTVDAASAAHIVADIQHHIEQHRLDDAGVLGDLELRIAAHFAPTHAGYDPIEQKPSHYGSQLSFAARIEPVVPPGMIYATEAFAAQVALEAADDFLLDYAGEVALAKQFGTYRLYSLRRRKTSRH